MRERQNILVFQQNGSAEAKINGIIAHGRDLFELQRFAIDKPLPPLIDNARPYLPADIQADLVLDFLKHPDLSHDLSVACSRLNIPVVASGKKLRIAGTLTPPT
jgi:hypothetical protein